MKYAAIAFVLWKPLGAQIVASPASLDERNRPIAVSRLTTYTPTRGVGVGGYVRKPGSYDPVENETLAALINRAGGIPASQAELERFRRGEQLFLIRISIYRDRTRREFRLDPKSNELWSLILRPNDFIQVGRWLHFEGFEDTATIIFKKPEVEQAGSSNGG